MSVYLINYDLNKTKDYDAVYAAIKSYGSWAKIQDSTWAICTDRSMDEVWEQIWNQIDNDDYLFISKLEKALWSISHNVEVREWLKNNL